MLVVTTRVPPLTARTWVRADGLVLRQEVPLFFLKLVLERLPESESGVGAAPGPEDPRP
jgi:hypothetical protein